MDEPTAYDGVTPGRATPTLFWRRRPPPPRPRVLIAACGVARGTGRGTPTRRRPHKTAPPRAQQVHVGHQRRRPLTGAVFRRPDIVSCLPFFLHQLIIDRPFGGHYAAVSKGLWKRAPGRGGGHDRWMAIHRRKKNPIRQLGSRGRSKATLAAIHSRLWASQLVAMARSSPESMADGRATQIPDGKLGKKNGSGGWRVLLRRTAASTTKRDVGVVAIDEGRSLRRPPASADQSGAGLRRRPGLPKINSRKRRPPFDCTSSDIDRNCLCRSAHRALSYWR